jgi:hypothetical protein
MPFHVGLDLGQAADYTALAVVHSVHMRTPDGKAAKGLHLRHLERYPLRTPYPEIVEKVAALLRDERLAPTEYDPSRGRYSSRQPALVVDNTGVGVAVTDLLKGKGLKFTPVTITGGETVHKTGRNWRVPKRNLVAALEVPFHTGELKVAEGLTLWPVLREELLNFRRKVKPEDRSRFLRALERNRSRRPRSRYGACLLAGDTAAQRLAGGGCARTGEEFGGWLPLSMYPNPYCIGLDLGQSDDYTALAIVETVGNDGRVTHRRSQRRICT